MSKTAQKLNTEDGRRRRWTTAWHAYAVTALLVVAAAAVQLFPGSAAWLEYRRAAVEAGELWRIITCHWTHFGFDHFIWDVATLAFVGALCEERSRMRFLLCVGLSVVAIPFVIWAFLPEMQTYRGLSGIDAAAFALLAVLILRDNLKPRRWGWIAFSCVGLAAFVCKIGIEMFAGSAVFVDGAAAGMIPVPLAHLVGAAAGVFAGLMPPPRGRTAKRRSLGHAALRAGTPPSPS